MRRPEDIQSELILMAWCTHPGMKLWYTNNSPFTSYSTVIPHSDSRSNFSTYVMSHVQYMYV